MVIRNHRKLYRKSEDPWNVGDADSERYNRYVKILRENCGGSVLDMGCGTGAFLNRLNFFTERFGFDISEEAMNRASSKYPSCNWATASIINPPTYRMFDTIICSDVIYYVWRKRKVMRWISEHLQNDGVAFIAAYSPGGRYMTPEGLNKLVSRYMDVFFQETLESGHTVILARKKVHYGAFTVDYENWMPNPGDFFAEVYGPAMHLTNLGIPITFFVDMAGLDKRGVPQLKEFAKLGHDLQLHYHFGYPDPYVSAESFGGSVIETLKIAKKKLERMSGRPVVAYRAGAYQVQPFSRLSSALRQIGIVADTSVWNGGVSQERGYDFRGAPTFPYWPHSYNPVIPLHTHGGIIEIPITTKRGKRWSDSYMFQPKGRYNVLIAHTKGGHNWPYIENSLRRLDIEWITMFEMVDRVRTDLMRNMTRLCNAMYSVFWETKLSGLCDKRCRDAAKVIRGFGFKVRQISLRAEGMPNGRGKRWVDTHEVLGIECNGIEYVVDPTERLFYMNSLDEILSLKIDWPSKKGMYCGMDFFSKVTHYRYLMPKGLRWFPNWKKNKHGKWHA